MLNQVVLVGRLVKEVEVKELENNKKVGMVTIAIPRSFKNENGEYDTDFVDIKLWDMVCQSACEYIHKGDIIGVKGRLQNLKEEESYKTEVVAEKVTFLSSKRD